MDSIEQLGKFGREQLIDLSLLALEGNERDPVSYIQFVHGLVAVVADCLREVPALKPIDIVLDIIENAAKGTALGAILPECISAFLPILPRHHLSPIEPLRKSIMASDAQCLIGSDAE